MFSGILIHQFFRVNDGSLLLDDNYIKSILKWSTSRINKLQDLLSNNLLFLWISPVPENNLNNNQLNVVKAVSSALKNNQSDVNREELRNIFKELAAEENIPFSDLMKLIRNVVSGLKVSYFVH